MRVLAIARRIAALPASSGRPRSREEAPSALSLRSFPVNMSFTL